MKGTKRWLYSFGKTGSMQKFQIILFFNLFSREYYCKVLRRLKFTTQCTVKRRPCPHSKIQTATTAINNLVSLQPLTSTKANISQIITKALTTDTEHRQLCPDFGTIIKMSKANSSYRTPKDIVLSLMPFVKKETKLTSNKATGNEVSKDFLHYRCPKPACPKPVVTFAEKTGFRNPFSHLQSCYGRGKTPQEQDFVLKPLFENARQDMERKGGTILSHF